MEDDDEEAAPLLFLRPLLTFDRWLLCPRWSGGLFQARPDVYDDDLSC